MSADRVSSTIGFRHGWTGICRRQSMHFRGKREERRYERQRYAGRRARKLLERFRMEKMIGVRR